MKSEKEFWDELYNKLCDAKDAHYDAVFAHEAEIPEYPTWIEAYADLAKPRGKMKVGSTVRITLVSNMGDFCINYNPACAEGYDDRILPGQGFLTNFRYTR